MAKLINLNVYDAKNMICVWNEKSIDDGWQCGIALDDADCGFMIPKYYIVGVFDDGSSKAAGIHDLSDINQDGDEDDNDLFLFNEFVYTVGIYEAKAFVRHEINDAYCEEDKAKAIVYEQLLESGVAITDEARRYLSSQRTTEQL